MATSDNVIGFIDGENLVARFQTMVAKGHVPNGWHVHIPDVFIWHHEITDISLFRISRLSYYQTVVGDEDKLNHVREQIRATKYYYHEDLKDQGHIEPYGRLSPRIFKKASKGVKTKSVDINLTVDALRHANQPKWDVIWIFSGDGDYLPLVEEISRLGKQVWLSAFSSGLNPRLKHAADDFFSLDDVFFKPIEDDT